MIGNTFKPQNEIELPIVSLETQCLSVTVLNQAERDAAIETIKSVKFQRARIVEFFQDSKEKAHAAWKSIVASEKSFTDRLDAVKSKFDKAVLSFDLKAETERQAEQARRQREADEFAKKERERLEREAAKIKTPELRERRMEVAAAIVAPVVFVPSASFPSAGSSIRKTWKARVIDAAAVPREFLIVNEKALDAFAKATKGVSKVAGVEFYEDKTLTTR